MMDDVSILILAGGKSQRMGKNKAFLPLFDSTFIQNILNNFGKLSSRIFISGNPEIYKRYNLPVLSDQLKFEEKGPMSGIYSGLLKAKTEWLFVISVDSPQIKILDLENLYKHKEGFKMILSKDENDIHPLVGLYHKSLIKPIQNNLENDKLSMKGLYLDKNLKTEFVQLEHPEKLKNINTPEEYRKEFMEVNIVFYGELAELVEPNKTLIISANTNLRDFKSLLIERFPVLENKIYKMSLNNAFADELTTIERQSKIDVFPPFAGG